MSKSVEGSYINLTDDIETIRKKVRSVPTATTAGGEMTGGIKTLFTLLKLSNPNEIARFENDFQNGNLRFVDLKDAVTEGIAKMLSPMQVKRKELEKDKTMLDSVIKDGTEKARSLAQDTIKDVRQKVGLA